MDKRIQGTSQGGLFEPTEEGYPKINECLICHCWQLEKGMKRVSIPSQGSERVTKLICESCYEKIMGEDKGKGP